MNLRRLAERKAGASSTTNYKKFPQSDTPQRNVRNTEFPSGAFRKVVARFVQPFPISAVTSTKRSMGKAHHRRAGSQFGFLFSVWVLSSALPVRAGPTKSSTAAYAQSRKTH
jgi:hypothetical protein